jgi:hypothetical protein
VIFTKLTPPNLKINNKYYVTIALIKTIFWNEPLSSHPGLGGLRAESSLAMVIWESRLSHRSRSSSLLISSNIRFTSLSPEKKQQNKMDRKSDTCVSAVFLR